MLQLEMGGTGKKPDTFLDETTPTDEKCTVHSTLAHRLHVMIIAVVPDYLLDRNLDRRGMNMQLCILSHY